MILRKWKCETYYRAIMLGIEREMWGSNWLVKLLKTWRGSKTATTSLRSSRNWWQRSSWHYLHHDASVISLRKGKPAGELYNATSGCDVVFNVSYISTIKWQHLCWRQAQRTTAFHCFKENGSFSSLKETRWGKKKS